MKENVIGFNSQNRSDQINNTNIFKYAQTEDLIKYGLIPELVGRFPIVAVLNELDKDHLYRILTEPKNAITKQFKTLFELDGVRIEFSEDELLKITEEAFSRGVGARGLRAIFEEIMLDLMYETPSKKEKIDKITVDFNFLKNKKWIA